MKVPFVAENLPFASAASVKFAVLHFDQIFLIVKLNFTLSSYYFIAECIKKKQNKKKKKTKKKKKKQKN